MFRKMKFYLKGKLDNYQLTAGFPHTTGKPTHRKPAREWEIGLHGSGTVNQSKKRDYSTVKAAHIKALQVNIDGGQKKKKIFCLKVENHH